MKSRIFTLLILFNPHTSLLRLILSFFWLKLNLRGTSLLVQSPMAVCLKARFKSRILMQGRCFSHGSSSWLDWGSCTLELPRTAGVYQVGTPGKGMPERKSGPGPCSGMDFSLPGEGGGRGPLKLPGKLSGAAFLGAAGPRHSWDRQMVPYPQNVKHNFPETPSWKAGT